MITNDNNRGKLLFRNDYEEMRFKKLRRKSLFPYGLAVFGLVIVIILFLYIGIFEANWDVSIYSKIAALIFFLLFIWSLKITAHNLFLAVKLTPFRIYENGIAFPNQPFKKFFPDALFLHFNDIEKITVFSSYFIDILSNGKNYASALPIPDFSNNVVINLLKDEVSIEFATSASLLKEHSDEWETNQ